MKVSNIFIILKNNNVWWGLNCKCVTLTSVNRRKEQRRRGDLYKHLYTDLNIHSQSITFRCAHLAAAVSGNLWKSRWSRSGHTNRVKLQVAGVLHFVIQELSWCILILTHKEITQTQSTGKEHWRLWTKPVEIKERRFRPLEKRVAFSQAHREHTVSGSSPHISNVSTWQLPWGNWGETEACRWLTGTLILQSTQNISFKYGPSSLMSNDVFLNSVTVCPKFLLLKRGMMWWLCLESFYG